MKLLIAFLLLSLSSSATNHYFSATGNNSNSGLTTGLPKQTLAQASSDNGSYASGDSVLFNCGDTFYGSLVIGRAGLIIGKYGTGANPIFTGLSTVTGWVNLGGNIWEAPTTGVSASNNLVLRDGVIQQIGRYPNAGSANGGYLTNTATTTTSITGPALSSTTNWTGAQVAIRFVRWDIKLTPVTSHSGGTIGFASFGYTPAVGFGYFFQRDPRTLDVDGEWWQDGTNNKLRMYFANNDPTVYTIQSSTVDKVISSLYGSLTIKDITINGSGIYGIWINGGANDLIKNCTVTNSGAEAISVYSTTANTTVDNCNVNNSLGSGILVRSIAAGGTITHAVTNCTVNNTALKIGMERSTEFNNGGSALTCKIGLGDSVRVLNNIVTNSGYCGIEWQGNNAYVKYNYVDNYCSVRDDGAGIYTVENGGSTLPTRYNRNVISNVISNAVGAQLGTTGAFETGVNGIYFDLGTRTVIADSNTIFNVAGNGFHGNNNADITARRNTVYNCSFSYSTQRFSDANLVRGFTITNNIFYPYRLQYRNLAINLPSLLTKQADLLAMGTFDYNYYSTKTGTDTSLNSFTLYDNGSNGAQTYLPFSYITGTVGQEIHSTNVANTGTFFYNATNTPTVTSLGGYNYTDLTGVTNYPGTITLQPFSSVVLLKTTPLAVGSDNSFQLIFQ